MTLCFFLNNIKYWGLLHVSLYRSASFYVKWATWYPLVISNRHNSFKCIGSDVQYTEIHNCYIFKSRNYSIDIAWKWILEFKSSGYEFPKMSVPNCSLSLSIHSGIKCLAQTKLRISETQWLQQDNVMWQAADSRESSRSVLLSQPFSPPGLHFPIHKIRVAMYTSRDRCKNWLQMFICPFSAMYRHREKKSGQNVFFSLEEFTV